MSYKVILVIEVPSSLIRGVTRFTSQITKMKIPSRTALDETDYSGFLQDEASLDVATIIQKAKEKIAHEFQYSEIQLIRNVTDHDFSQSILNEF
jgi:hypothetical protein